MANFTISDLPSVRASFNYLVPSAQKPFRYAYEPPPGTPEHNVSFAAHEQIVRSARPIADRLSLDLEGFRLTGHASAVVDFHDEAEVRHVHYPEIEHLVARITGAARVVVFDHTLRRRSPARALVESGSFGADGVRGPVGRAHADYTVGSGPQRVRDLLGGEGQQLLEQRFSIINVWRPIIREPLLDSPLAVCDAQSLALGDLVASDLIYRTRVGETYLVTFNPAHRWFYVPRMRRDEALLFKNYDSDLQRAPFAPHSAFDDPTTPPDAVLRESIEVRTLAFYPA